ncbi:MAG: 6-bladed beta-propeller [Burkholderiales bacterium]|nr:6-bladed beta-propeller [Burkholderiales bacterium]
MAQVGSGKHTYEVIRDWPKLPAGESLGVVSRVVADARDRIYVFQRKDPPVVMFDRDGSYLGCWGAGAVKEAHGLKIVGDVAYTTDRPDSVAVAFTLDGKPLLVLGKRGVHSDTGCDGRPWLALRAGAPFNHPTEMIAHPNGDLYVTDGYRNCRVHRFSADGRLIKSWGTPGKGAGEFHLPHSIVVDRAGRLYVADRSNKRIQIFSPEGEFLGMWTGMGGPNDIALGNDGTFYIAEQEDGDQPAYICVRDGEGNVLARLESRHIHGVGVDSHGDIYAGLTGDHSVDKFVRQR